MASFPPEVARSNNFAPRFGAAESWYVDATGEAVTRSGTTIFDGRVWSVWTLCVRELADALLVLMPVLVLEVALLAWRGASFEGLSRSEFRSLSVWLYDCMLVFFWCVCVDFGVDVFDCVCWDASACVCA